MFNYCWRSGRTRLALFTLLAALLLLPLASFANYPTTFPVKVTYGDNLPLQDAEVIVWDNNSWGPVKVSGMTGTDGMVNVTLPSIVPNPSSTSNPAPNIGFMVVPPDTTSLAFNVHRIVFFNVFGQAVTAAQVDINLEQGAKVSLDLNYDDDPFNSSSALIQGMPVSGRLIVPGVPTGVTDSVLSLDKTELDTFYQTNPGELPSLYWPAGKSGNIQVYSDGAKGDYSNNKYFDGHWQSFTAGQAGEDSVVDVLQKYSPKGEVIVNVPTNVADSVARRLHYGHNLTAQFYGGQQVWLPYGNYGFNLVLGTETEPFMDSEGYGPTPGLWQDQVVGETPLVLDYTFDSGTGLTIEISLGTTEVPGNANALADTKVAIEKLTVSSWGGDYWTPVQTTPYPLGNGDITVQRASHRFFYRLEEGTYRIRPYCEIMNRGQGVVDTYGDTPLCFSYVPSEPFEVGAGLTTRTEVMTLPQAPAVMASINYTLSEFTVDTLRVGYLPQGGQSFGYELVSNSSILDSNGYNVDWQSYPTVSVFVPFAQKGQLAIRTSLYNTANASGIAPRHKVFAPISVAEGSGTIVPTEPFAINEANFATLSGQVVMNGQPFTGPANILISPKIPGTELYGSQVFYQGQNIDERGFDKEGLTDGSNFEFAFELNVDHKIEVVEHDVWPRRLNGVSPFEQVVNYTQAQTGVEIDITPAGGFFTGVIEDPNGPIPADAQVAITMISAEDKNKVRSGVVTGPNFRAAGLETALYNVFIDIGNVRSLLGMDEWGNITATDSLFAVQQSPVLKREVFVDANHPPTGDVHFKLDPSRVGFLSGRLIDDLGNPIQGVRVIAIPGRTEFEWYARDMQQGAFFFATDADGRFVQSGANPNLIPLESGEYSVVAYGLMGSGFDTSLDLGSDFHLKTLGVYEINAGRIRDAKDITVERFYQFTGVLSEDGQLLPSTNVTLKPVDSELSDRYAWIWANEEGAFSVPVKPGEYIAVLNMLYDGDVKRLHLMQVSIPMSDTPEFNKNLDFVSSSLKDVTIHTRAGEAIVKEAPVSVRLYAPDGRHFSFGSHDEYHTGMDDDMAYYDAWYSDANGEISVKLPDVSQIAPLSDFVYRFKPLNTSSYTADGIMKRYFALDGGVIDLNQSAAHIAGWTTGMRVEFAAQNADENHFGVLVEDKNFFGPPLHDPKAFDTPVGLGYLAQSARNTWYQDGSFVFTDVEPNKGYVFVAYEVDGELGATEIGQMYLGKHFVASASLLFRHVQGPIFVDANKNLTSEFGPVAELKVEVDPPQLLNSPLQVHAGFSNNRASTEGVRTWPAIYWGHDAINPDSAMAVPSVELPASHALILEFFPEDPRYTHAFSGNVFIPTTGRTHIFRPAQLNRVFGEYTYNGYPANLENKPHIFVVPAGADFKDLGNLPMVQANFNDDSNFEMYLKAGQYLGTALPSDGGASHIFNFRVEAGMDLDYFLVEADSGVEVVGKIVDADGNGVPFASAMVMRKPSPRSQLEDGQPMFPYAVFGTNPVVPADADGNIRFNVQKNVDYYVQARGLPGYRPGKPVKVVVNEVSPAPFDARMLTGATIKGTLNVQALVEAYPVAFNPAQEDYSDSPAFSGFAQWPTTDGRFEFELVGLNPGMLYNIVFTPEEKTGLAKKKLSNVPGTIGDLQAIDLTTGRELVGQLVDRLENPLLQPNHPVMLEILVPQELLAEPDITASMRFSMKANQVDGDVSGFDPADVTSMRFFAQTDPQGQYRFTNLPEVFVMGVLRSDMPFRLGEVNYAMAATRPFIMSPESTEWVQNLVVARSGAIIGRLINEAGQPVTAGVVDADNQEMRLGADVSVDSNGRFNLGGLPPGANYTLFIDDVPGRVNRILPHIQVKPGEVTDLGNIPVAEAVMVNGQVANLKPVIGRVFKHGRTDFEEMMMVAFDADYIPTDQDLLDETFLRFINGENDLIWDSSNVPDSVSFNMPTRPGRNHIGTVLARHNVGNATSIVTWGWRPNFMIPTVEQLGIGSFSIDTAFQTPGLFGSISGTLTHSVDTSAMFGPKDAVLALYPVDASGTLVPVPMPAAMVRPVNNRWSLLDVPYGRYRMKVITRRYGSQFFNRIIEIGDTHNEQNFALGTAVRKIAGRVLDAANNQPVESASVRMILRNLSTATDADGVFEFFVPTNEFVNPQLEIRRAGYEVVRALVFPDAVPSIATDGIRLTTDLALGDIKITSAAGVAEITVLDSQSQNPVVGAEVAIVIMQESADGGPSIYNVVDSRITDSSGAVSFSSVPVSGDIRFRARAHSYRPRTEVASAALNISRTMQLEQGPPRVFYMGFPELVDDYYFKLNASFDFGRVVEQGKISVTIGAENVTDLLTFPDAIGGRITTMKLTDAQIPTGDIVNAVVRHSDFVDPIGTFEAFVRGGGARFRREFEVDPFAADGFTGRVNDSQGNQLPIGLMVPPGYLPPEIDSFEIQVKDKPQNPAVTLDDDSNADMAGPSFEFTFNKGSHVSAGTQQKGLFEITIQYEPGSTNLEPRWKDTNGNWSKVGVVEESIRWDHPEAGYVTFKVDHLTEFAVLANVAGSSSGYRGDLTGNGSVGMADIAIYLAWYINGGTTDKAVVQNSARQLYPSGGDFVVMHLPSVSAEDFNADSARDMSDIAIILSWYINGGTTDETVITNGANSLLGSMQGSTQAIPGMPVTR